MTRFAFAALAASLAAPALSAPYCDAMITGADLPSKYARMAPIYSNTDNGWIFTSDQLRDRYDMKSSADALVKDIVAEFAKRDVALAIVVAPPRPVVAGQELLNSTMGDDQYDVAAAQASFAELIEGLNGAGAIAPDLQALALSEPQLREDFYFKRDTHWTTVGAARSAIALAEAVRAKQPDLFASETVFGVSDLSPSDEIEEKGSLAKIAREACDLDVQKETSVAFDLSDPNAAGLLGGGDDKPRIALVGSSFSDRYKRDHYRFGDALARAFDAEIDNYSVSGGGGIGAIEHYVLSGELEKGAHSLVVWELPYTESFNSTSMLAQLLGALRFGADHVETSGATGTAISIELPSDEPVLGASLMLRGDGTQRTKLVIGLQDGKSATINVSRRGALPAEARELPVFVSFAQLVERGVTSIDLEVGKGTEIASATAIR